MSGVIGAGVGRTFGETALGGAMAQLGATVLVLLLRRRLMTRTECHPSSGAWSALGGVAGLLVAWPIVQWAAVIGNEVGRTLMNVSAPALAHESLRALENAGWSWDAVVIVVIAVVIAPFVEEVLYRGVIQQTLRAGGLRRRAAIVVTAALFALMHLGDGAIKADSAWTAVPALFALGLLFGVLYERTGRLSAPIAAHALFNAVNVAQLFTGA